MISSVDLDAKATTVYTSDRVNIAYPDGAVSLKILTGICGIGGLCAPEESISYNIIETYTTKITVEFF